MRTIGKVTITLLVGSALLVSGQEKPLPSNNKYYEEQLQALKESPIGNLRSEGVTQSYKLVWLRTFLTEQMLFHSDSFGQRDRSPRRRVPCFGFARGEGPGRRLITECTLSGRRAKTPFVGCQRHCR